MTYCTRRRSGNWNSAECVLRYAAMSSSPAVAEAMSGAVSTSAHAARTSSRRSANARSSSGSETLMPARMTPKAF